MLIHSMRENNFRIAKISVGYAAGKKAKTNGDAAVSSRQMEPTASFMKHEPFHSEEQTNGLWGNFYDVRIKWVSHER